MIKEFIKKYGLFLSFLLGGFASGLPTLLEELFPQIRVYVIILFFIFGWLISFILTESNIKSKIYWTIAGIIFFAYLIYKLPSINPPVEILSPKNYENISVEESTGLITISGTVAKELFSRFDENSLNIYVVKFDSNGKLHFESKEPAQYKNGYWIKKLPFYKDQEFKILAIAASSPEIAEDHAILSKAHKSNITTFKTLK